MLHKSHKAPISAVKHPNDGGFYGTGYISAKDTKNAMKTTIVGAVINLIVNLLLIPVIDIWAACLSTVCGNIVVWAMRVKHTKKYFKISVDWKSFYFIMIVNVAFTFLNCFSNNIITFLMIGFAIVISIVINKTVISKKVFFERSTFMHVF